MKRIIAIASAIVLLALFTGCSALAGLARKVLPGRTAAASQPSGTAVQLAPTKRPRPSPKHTETPAPTGTPAPTETAPAQSAIDYTSQNLCITFTLPAGWAGKYRVVEGDNYLSVYFKPEAPIEDGLGNLFSIVMLASADEDYFLDNAQKFTINDEIYVFGTPTDVPYFEENPEYETFRQMLKDLPGIAQSIRAQE